MFTSDAQIIEIGKKRNSALYVINVINGYADRLSADFSCSRPGKRISVFGYRKKADIVASVSAYITQNMRSGSLGAVSGRTDKRFYSSINNCITILNQKQKVAHKVRNIKIKNILQKEFIMEKQTIYKNPLSCPEDVKDFIMEGKADVYFVNSKSV